MNKKILSLALAAGMLLGASASVGAAEGDILSPAAVVEIDDETGYIRGFTGAVKAETVKEQFSAEVTLTSHSGKALEAGDACGSDTAVIADGESIAKVLVPGDLTRDGKINLADVSQIMKYSAKWEVDACTAAGDVTGDGRMNLNDASTVLKYAAMWEGVVLGRPVLVDIFKAGTTEYKLLATDYSDAVKASLEAIGATVEVTDTEEGRLIVVGKDLHLTYDFIDGDRVGALKDTEAYICMYDGNIYLTAHTENGMLGCINYIGNMALSAELDFAEAKGRAEVLDDRETLVHSIRTTLEIEGLENEYRFLHVTDSHLTTIYEDEETEGRRANVTSRLNDWMMNQYRKPSYLYFDEYFNYAELLDADAMLLTGDITDSPSKSNRDIFAAAVDGCSVPSFYIYGNHDWTWNTNEAEGDQYQDSSYRTIYLEGFTQVVDRYDPDWNQYGNIYEYEDLILCFVDNSAYGYTRQSYLIMNEAVELAKETGRPMILMTHIPFHTDEMHENCDRITGNGYCIQPGTQFSTLATELVCAEDTPIKAVICGHVHVNYETVLPNGVPQYLTAPALEGWCRVIDLVPAE